MENRERIAAPVAEAFKHFEEDFEQALQSQAGLLQSAIGTILGATGKHLRPLLVLLAAKACGKVTNHTVNAAVLLELLHTATLIHDDVIDKTYQRRGVSSLNAVFDNRISVLVGDYILSTALIRSIQTDSMRIVAGVSALGRELAEGEIIQLDTSRRGCWDEAQYMRVIRKKTAALLSACAEIGAISAGAPDQTVAICRDFGELLGYCFQLRDDIFDYHNDTTIGKPTGNDIREGKITLPLLYALTTGNEREVRHFKEVISRKDFSPRQTDALIAFAIRSGGIKYAEQKMEDFRSRALDLIEQLPHSVAKESLILLAHYITDRKK